MSYTPDKWVVLKITDKDTPTIFKVFACWYGGYTGSDYWQANSGITAVTKEEFGYSFNGVTGSVYDCANGCYGTNGYGDGVLNHLIKRASEKGCTIEILPKDTDWAGLPYNLVKN